MRSERGQSGFSPPAEPNRGPGFGPALPPGGPPSFDDWWDDLNKKPAPNMPNYDLAPPSMRKDRWTPTEDIYSGRLGTSLAPAYDPYKVHGDKIGRAAAPAADPYASSSPHFPNASTVEMTNMKSPSSAQIGGSEWKFVESSFGEAKVANRVPLKRPSVMTVSVAKAAVPPTPSNPIGGRPETVEPLDKTLTDERKKKKKDKEKKKKKKRDKVSERNIAAANFGRCF